MLPNAIQKYQKALTQAAQSAQLTYLGVFGSQSRDEANSSSDIDFLFDYHPDNVPSLFKLGTFRDQVVSLLHTEVDLVSRKALNPRLKPYILPDLQTIYEKK